MRLKHVFVIFFLLSVTSCVSKTISPTKYSFTSNDDKDSSYIDSDYINSTFDEDLHLDYQEKIKSWYTKEIAFIKKKFEIEDSIDVLDLLPQTVFDIVRATFGSKISLNRLLGIGCRKKLLRIKKYDSLKVLRKEYYRRLKIGYRLTKEIEYLVSELAILERIHKLKVDKFKLNNVVKAELLEIIPDENYDINLESCNYDLATLNIKMKIELKKSEFEVLYH